MDDSTLQFLINRKQQGYTQQQVIQELMQSGWTAEQARFYTQPVFYEPAAVSPSSGSGRRFLKIGIIVFVSLVVLSGAGGGVWWFLQKQAELPPGNLEALTECNFDFNLTDWNEDVAVAPDNSLIVVNYGAVARYHADGETCTEVWKRSFQSDDQQAAVDSETVWVASRSHDAIGAFDLKTGEPKSFEAEGLSFPKGVALQGGQLFVAGFEGLVRVYDKNSGGIPVSTYLGTTENLYLYDIVPGTNGEIYVLQNDELSLSGGTVVAQYDASSSILDPAFLTTAVSSHLVRDGSGNWYITDSSLSHDIPNQVKKYSPEQELLQTWSAERGWIITSFTVHGGTVVTAQVPQQEYGLPDGSNKIVIYE